MLTVLMATHNGARTLPRVLDAFGRLHPPEGGWKLVAVNNGSTDGTGEILTAFTGRLPIECLTEGTVAQNRARNRGLAAVEGDLLVLADDAVIPRPAWLAEMRRVADDHPDFSMFGGVILPCWEIPPEEWLLEWVPLSLTFALTDEAWEEGPIKADLVFSPNMAIRAEVFRRGLRFDETIGPREGSYPMGSETELTRRLTREGHRAWHTRRAVVEHIIRASQMTRAWILARAVRYGRGQYRLGASSGGRGPRGPLGVPPGLLAGILVQAGWVALTGLAGDRERLFHRRWSLNYLLGKVREARALRREAGRPEPGAGNTVS
jgi:glycosyltransferase involved in cell wall biosynthesis